MHPRNHSLTHKFTHSHTQTGHFHGALQNNIHQWEEEIQKGLNWHRLLAERCWKSHFWGRKQLDTKKRKTSYWPENQWDDRHNELCPQCRHVNREQLKRLRFPLACHLRDNCSPLNGISHEHRFDFIRDIYCTTENYSLYGCWKQTNCLSATTQRFLFSCPSWRWTQEKTHLRNGSTCLMLVNKYHTLDVAGEEPYEPDLFTPFQEKKLFLQQSSCQKWSVYVTKLRRTLRLHRLSSLSWLTSPCRASPTDMYTYTVNKHINEKLAYHVYTISLKTTVCVEGIMHWSIVCNLFQ